VGITHSTGRAILVQSSLSVAAYKRFYVLALKLLFRVWHWAAHAIDATEFKASRFEVA
jgi:hypothetical protein